MALLEVGNLGPWWLELLRLVVAAVVGGGAGIWMSQRQTQKQIQEQAQKQSQKQAQDVDQRQQQEVTVGAEEQDRVFEVDCGCYPDHSVGPDSEWPRVPVPNKRISIHVAKGIVTTVMCDQFRPADGTCTSECNRHRERQCVCLLRVPAPLTPPASAQ